MLGASASAASRSQQLAETQDGMHRRAQLMAHARQELGLRAVGGFGLVARMHQLQRALLHALLELGIERAQRLLGARAAADVAQVQHHAAHRRVGQAVVGQDRQVPPLPSAWRTRHTVSSSPLLNSSTAAISVRAAAQVVRVQPVEDAAAQQFSGG